MSPERGCRLMSWVNDLASVLGIPAGADTRTVEASMVIEKLGEKPLGVRLGSGCG
jgi:hypothetical protein